MNKSLNLVTENLQELYALFSIWQSASVIVDDKFVQTTTRFKHPIFNSVVSSTYDIEKLTEKSDLAREHYIKAKVPALWWQPKREDDVSVQPTITEQGFVYLESGTSMGIDLSVLSAQAPEIEQCKISRVRDADTLKLWCDVFCEGYELPKYVGELFNQFYSLVGLDGKAKIQHYLCYLKGKPVGTVSVFYSKKTAGIYNVSTLPSARKQGVASLLTSTALSDSKKSNYNKGVLIASNMAVKLYKNIGFTVNGTFEQYMLLSSEQ